MTIRCVVGLVLVLLLPGVLSADIFGMYPGVDKMVERSGSIAIVRVEGRMTEKDGRWQYLEDVLKNNEYDPSYGTISGTTAPVGATILHTLKGPLEEGITTATLLGLYPARPAQKTEDELFRHVLTYSRNRNYSEHLGGAKYFIVFFQPIVYNPWRKNPLPVVLNVSGSMVPLEEKYAIGQDGKPRQIHPVETMIREAIVRQSTPGGAPLPP